MPRPFTLKRRGLAFPGGMAPGFDPSHPALQSSPSSDHFVFSAVASGAAFNFLYAPAVVSPLSPTIVGTPAAIIDGRMGPVVKFPTGSTYTWTEAGTYLSTTTTAAAIFVVNSTATHQYLFSFGGLAFGVFDSGSAQLCAFDGFSNFVASGLTLTVGVPYFAIWSASAGATRFLLKRLDTGAVTTATTAGMSQGITMPGGFVIGANRFGDSCLSSIAALAYTSNFLGFAQMQQWAADPWAFWYPTPINVVAFDPITAFAAAGVVAAIQGIIVLP